MALDAMASARSAAGGKSAGCIATLGDELARSIERSPALGERVGVGRRRGIDLRMGAATRLMMSLERIAEKWRDRARRSVSLSEAQGFVGQQGCATYGLHGLKI